MSGWVRGPASRSARRRAPPGVTVQSMVASRLPARSPDRVRVSSRLARVAASMASAEPELLAGRRVEDRSAADLRLLDVEERAAGGRDRGAVERAEGVEGRDAEIILETALRRGRIEAVSRESGVIEARVSRQKRLRSGSSWMTVRHQDLARLEAGDLGGKAGSVGLA